jgi:hypothetical protein
VSTTHPHHPPTMGTTIAGTCAVAGCERPHHARGLCHTHYTRHRRAGDPGPTAITPRGARDPLCTVADCTQPHHALGYCHTHYSRWRRTGTIGPATPPNPRGCGIPGCGQRHYARGLCRTHYRRWQQAGGVQPTLDITECAQLYCEGTSSTSLARLYGRTPHTILTALRAAGVPIRAPGRHQRAQPH